MKTSNANEELIRLNKNVLLLFTSTKLYVIGKKRHIKKIICREVKNE